jgi:HEPN domain-containing protein
MRPLEEVKKDLVRQWLAKANEDFNAAKVLLSFGTSFLATIGFHCQQAAEKYCKAFLTWHQIEFPKTHDLELLLGLISLADQTLAASLNQIATLNPYGVEIRYPGDLKELTPEEVIEAIQLAERAKESIIFALGPL